MNEIISYVHSPSLHLLLYFVPFLIITAILIVLARFLKYYHPEISYGYGVIFFWSLVISILFFGDYFKINVFLVVGLSLFSAIVFVVFTVRKFKVDSSKLFEKKILLYEVKILLIWAAGLFLIAVPALFVFPKNTVIPTPVINTDSMMHSMLAKGYAYTEQIGLNNYWATDYPRAFHSVIFTFTEVTGIEGRTLLLPIALFFYSFITFVAEDIISKRKGLDRIHKFLIPLMTCVPFLILMTLYMLFAPQIAVIPLLIFCVYNIFKLKFNKENTFAYLTLTVAILTVIGIYGIYAINVVGLAGLIKIALELGLKFKSKIKSTAGYFIKDLPRYWLSILLIIILSVPILITFEKNVVTTIKSPVTFQGAGNLYKGFLSPLHLTGMWDTNTEFRDFPTSMVEYTFIFILIVELFFIFKAKLSKTLILANLVLAGLVFAGAFVFKNSYINFKYLTYYLPFFMITIGISVALVLKGKLKIFSYVLLALFIFLALYIPLDNFARLTSDTTDTFVDFDYINNTYITKYKTLSLVTDVWIQYYAVNHDDYSPLADYALRNEYKGQDVDYIIQDAYYSAPELGEKFIKDYPKLKNERDLLPDRCIDHHDRFTIYNLKCSV